MAIHQPHELEERPQGRREWSGTLRSLVLPIGLVVAIVGGLLYYEARRGTTEDSTGFGTVALPSERNKTGREPVAEQGRAAPDFLLATLDGDPLRFSDLQGKPVLVNFWATWCTTCRIEMPELVETKLRYGSELEIVAVDLREADSRVRPFVEEFGLPFRMAMDRNGEVARTWRIGGPNEGVPSTYFIDRDGIVQKVVFGLLTEKTIEDGLALILAPAN
jgi:peroxiredoxin